jgi:hypothetical protein
VSNKIVPIGGQHQSARSLLAEVMNDEELDSVVLVAFLKDGTPVPTWYGTTMANMSYAIMILQQELMFAGADPEDNVAPEDSDEDGA